MAPIIALAAIGAAATAATAAATGDASALAHVLPPGLKIALTHVPSWSHAYHVITQHLSAYGQSSPGSAVGIGSAMKALAHGIGHA